MRMMCLMNAHKNLIPDYVPRAADPPQAAARFLLFHSSAFGPDESTPVALPHEHLTFFQLALFRVPEFNPDLFAFTTRPSVLRYPIAAIKTPLILWETWPQTTRFVVRKSDRSLFSDSVTRSLHCAIYITEICESS